MLDFSDFRSIVAMMFIALAKVEKKPHYSQLPVTPNLLKDTKQFKNVCEGQKATPMNPWDEKKKAFGGEWEAWKGPKVGDNGALGEPHYDDQMQVMASQLLFSSSTPKQKYQYMA